MSQNNLGLVNSLALSMMKEDLLWTGASGSIWDIPYKGELYMETIARKHARNALLFLFALTIVPLSAPAGESYSPYVDGSYPTNVYWGDTHVHTALSGDAFGTGTRLMPEDAYRFAKGKKIRATGGEEVRLLRPLDFLMLSDHAENLGVLPHLVANDGLVPSNEVSQRWAEFLAKVAPLSEILNMETFEAFNRGSGSLAQGKGAWQADYGVDKRFQRMVWEEVIANAERHNDPGMFTAFIGYEWSARVPNSNIHRNVLFEGGADQTRQVLPISRFDSVDPEYLWAYLQDYKDRTKGKVIAIPHNGNLSAGQMFKLSTYKDQPFTKAYARTRSHWEPIVEVTQIKGDGETHPLVSPNDEFADYETFRWVVPQSHPAPVLQQQSKALGYTQGRTNDVARGKMQNKDLEGGQQSPVDLVAQSYARSALKLGLSQEVELGVNPFKFGMIGSTDSHTALATADEDNFWGKFSSNEPSRYRVRSGWTFSAAGYAAVWAQENTREALFASMRRKEVYASTGPRMIVRFFGGWGYTAGDAVQPDFALVGYAKGVPMGGDLTAAPEGKAPSFLIRAVKDPAGANLDRVQVIKGWRDENGELHETIHNVALSDGRKEDRWGEVEPVGSTVDVKDASYTNSIGDAVLAAVWTDLDFDRDEHAFYYVRVLEIPTPRWTAYDAKFYGLKLTEQIPLITQERVYTSPIWYTP